MSDEKRSFSRIQVRLKAHARTMRSINSTPLFTGDVVCEESGREALFRSSKLPEDLTNFLAQMDRKLDSILGLLSRETIKSDFPMEIEVMELSGAGVKFRSPDTFKPDEALEVVLVLSQIPLRMAGSKGRILGEKDEAGLYRFEFVDTRGSDMEAIVQFVFQQQREQIRNSKL